MHAGNAQIYFWGWLADYPDPENFLFLLYGPDGEVKFGGENSSNYQNAEYDHLFEQMKVLPNGAERQKVINQMLAIVRKDAPWAWGLHLKEFILTQQWVYPMKPDAMGNNTLKYQKINPQLRVQKQQEWNQAKWWPLLILILIIIISLIPIFFKYWRQQHSSRVRRIGD
jgi:oligopeptide transport system substrate-binding protein